MRNTDKIKVLTIALFLIIIILLIEFLFFYSQKSDNKETLIIKPLKIDNKYKSVFENKKNGTYIFETKEPIEITELQNISSNLNVDENTKSSKTIYLFRPDKLPKNDNYSKKQIENLNPIVGYKKTKNAEYIYLYSDNKVIRTYYKDKSTLNQWTLNYSKF